jgi:hypothetical protein
MFVGEQLSSYWWNVAMGGQNACNGILTDFAPQYDSMGFLLSHGRIACRRYATNIYDTQVFDFPIGGFSPPEGRLACGFKPPAFSRFLFQSAVKSAESF